MTDGERTFNQWWVTFDEAPEDRGKYAPIIAEAVFATGLAALGQRLAAG